MSSSLDYYCVGDAVCDEILGLLSKFGNEAIAKRGIFRVGVSGGSIADILAEGMYDIRTDFTKWQIFFCDERIVPVDSKDSTYGVFERDMLSYRKNVPKSAFFPVNCTLSPTEAAADYEKTIRKAFNMENTTDIPSFDLLILGIGPDGHTASLFPGHPLLDEKTKLIAAITDSPKPPPNRVTMTYPLINNAKICMFGAQGQSKAEVLKRILVDKDESLPVTRVDPKNGELIFIACDEADSLIDVDPTRKAKKG
ncbi:6-phosphogluconolactonase-like isoform X1 [Toxorhynchites rutilus septentrionalis]|uniref:6-phosphogluconolactonase-like isoform X1 n=1 Tax=Toxorhynchites rutilus septentrionalis TaxID=329112 RepID=UPI00247A7BB2|nr:6-phosphogluconolactonase-like isoform X1 [Toxorhynchites rutilus septentrionalis]